MFTWKNIKVYYLIVKRKIRNFLLTEQSREFFIFLFFFLMSTGFWLLQTLKNDFQTEFSIPIKLKDIPNDVVITSELQNQVKVTLKDKGTVLLNYLFGQSFYPVTIDFSDYQNRGNHVKILGRELERKVTSQLNASTTLVGVKPDTLDFIYTQGKARKLPVRFNGTVSMGRQYYVTDTVFSPDSVTVYAPSEMLDTMRYINTRWLELDNLGDTTKVNAPIQWSKGMKVSPSSVQLTIPVDVITEKTVEVPLIPVNFPKDKALRTFPSKVKVVFQVGLERFKNIYPEDFVLVVPYEDLLKNKGDKYTLELRSVPSGVSHVRIIPQEIDYLIEQTSELHD